MDRLRAGFTYVIRQLTIACYVDRNIIMKRLFLSIYLMIPYFFLL